MMERVQFKLTVNRHLHSMIEREAKRHGRSANQEAVRRLELTFELDEDAKAQLKEIHDREMEFADHRNKWIEQQTRREAQLSTALRDSEIINIMLGGDENARLLRAIVKRLSGDPHWAANAESRKSLAGDIRKMVES